MKIHPPPHFCLSQLPTPIEMFHLSPAPKSRVDIFIKRDDLTGSILSGNKIRKLEFHLYDIIANKAEIAITCGGIQSNHCRAVAAICAMAGLECHLVLKGKVPKIPDGNYFLSTLMGARTHFITVREYEENVAGIMDDLARKFRESGRRTYIIPEGASDSIGAWGYVKAMTEIKKQVDKAGVKLDAIAVAVGSGGTYAGLYLGARLLNWEIDILGFSVNRSADYFQRRIFDICVAFEADIGKSLSINPSEIKIDDGFIGPGYAKIGSTERDFIRDVARHSGIVLDPAYTAKALLGLFSYVNDGRFRKGSKVLFIHTGGQWGLLPMRNEFVY
jgi:D-cysteine desulfhydrase